MFYLRLDMLLLSCCHISQCNYAVSESQFKLTSDISWFFQTLSILFDQVAELRPDSLAVFRFIAPVPLLRILLASPVHIPDFESVQVYWTPLPVLQDQAAQSLDL